MRGSSSLLETSDQLDAEQESEQGAEQEVYAGDEEGLTRANEDQEQNYDDSNADEHNLDRDLPSRRFDDSEHDTAYEDGGDDQSPIMDESSPRFRSAGARSDNGDRYEYDGQGRDGDVEEEERWDNADEQDVDEEGEREITDHPPEDAPAQIHRFRGEWSRSRERLVPGDDHRLMRDNMDRRSGHDADMSSGRHIGGDDAYAANERSQPQRSGAGGAFDAHRPPGEDDDDTHDLQAQESLAKPTSRRGRTPIRGDGRRRERKHGHRRVGTRRAQTATPGDTRSAPLAERKQPDTRSASLAAHDFSHPVTNPNATAAHAVESTSSKTSSDVQGSESSPSIPEPPDTKICADFMTTKDCVHAKHDIPAHLLQAPTYVESLSDPLPVASPRDDQPKACVGDGCGTALQSTELTRAQKQFAELKKTVSEKRQWVKRVGGLIRHYSNKMATVKSELAAAEAELKSQAKTVEKAERKHHRRLHHARASKTQSSLLSRMNQQMHQLKHINKEFRFMDKNLVSVQAKKARLMAGIRSLQSRISALKAAEKS